MGAQGVSALPLLVVEHPLGGERPEAIARRAQQAFEQLNAIVAGSARPAQAVGGLSETARAPHAESTDPMTVADDPIADPQRRRHLVRGVERDEGRAPLDAGDSVADDRR